MKFSKIFHIKFSSSEGWEAVEWEDLNTPLLSALAARLLLYTAEKNNYSIPTSSDIEGQASFWNYHYNTDGNTDKFIEDIGNLDHDEGKKLY